MLDKYEFILDVKNIAEKRDTNYVLFCNGFQYLRNKENDKILEEMARAIHLIKNRREFEFDGEKINVKYFDK